MAEHVKVGKKQIKLGNVDKTIFEDAEISKKEIIGYYEKIAEHMLPFLKDRPLMLQRFPNGINHKGFFQKERPSYFPEWIDSTTVSKREGGSITHVVCNDTPSLVYLANQACITFHTWQSKKEDPEKPDRIVMDLDPSGDDFKLLKNSLVLLRDYLEEIGVVSFPMATGSRGFHIVFPITPKNDFDEIKVFTNRIADDLVGRHPDHFTTAARKVKRGKFIYLDMQRNAYAQTSVAPYTLRAKTYAPVAAPLDWPEAISAEVSSKQYNIKTIFNRLAQKKDAWEGFFDEKLSQENLKALQKLT